LKFFFKNMCGLQMSHTSTSEPIVGASLLAKDSRAPRSLRRRALSLTFFAGKPALAGGGVFQSAKACCAGPV